MKTEKECNKVTIYKIVLCVSAAIGYISANNMIFLLENQPHIPWDNQIIALYIVTIVMYAIAAFSLIKIENS